MQRPATTDFPTLDLIRDRWSPRAFAARSLAPATLRTLLEAARWAPSCFNEQPWHYLVALRDEEERFANLLDCLVPANQRWANQAGAVVVTVARTTFARNGKPNLHAWHDVGLASAQLTLQATAFGLVVHQMAGIDREKIVARFGIPAGYEAVSGIAIGYPGDPASLPEDLRLREQDARQRRPQSEFVFGARWQEAWVDAPTAARVDAVLDFWFGELDADGQASPAVQARWWKKDAAFDAEIRSRFAADHASLMAGSGATWLATPRGRLAYVIVLDQFSRNMFRDTPGMFAADAHALDVALAGIARGDDRALPLAQRVFFYLPLMHSEELAMQERCVELFRQLVDEVPEALRPAIAAGNLDFAIRHCDIIARFHRFPHRNAILGRESTPQEIEFLQTPGSSF